MHDDLWQGVDFKVAEAEFFLDRMGKVLIPRHLTDRNWQAAYGLPTVHWQPDFYFYLDAFIAAARSIADIVQKCFGWDPHSKKEWPEPLDDDERRRRDAFQAEFTAHYAKVNGHAVSRVRTGTFHWGGTPSVQTKARVFGGGDYTGSPKQAIPIAAPRQFPPGTDAAYLALFGAPQPVEPSWQDFTLEIPRDDGTRESKPLFAACREYLESARLLVRESREIAQRVHGSSMLTAPLPLPRDKRA
ncbi:MAG TPA: hypothetical protein VFI31_23625 [Pirellulales bacterium]|nr:hypothetical protein [Pirellulales bacterium]